MTAHFQRLPLLSIPAVHASHLVNCEEPGRCGKLGGEAAPVLLERCAGGEGGASLLCPPLRQAPGGGKGSCNMQAAIDAEVEAAARDTMLAQCQALLSLDDPESLPHDPLFDLLPAQGMCASAAAAAARRQQRAVCSPAALAAALAAAAAEAEALKRAAPGAAVVAESMQSTLSTLAVTRVLLAPETCCRKRTADAGAPTTLPCDPSQRRLQQQQLLCGSPAVIPAGSGGIVAAGPASVAAPTCGGSGIESTPYQARLQGLAAAKRQRLLQLSASGAKAAAAVTSGASTGRPAGASSCGGGSGGTPAPTPAPGSGVGSSSKACAERRAARRGVARDLSFTPAPPLRPKQAIGTPSTAGSASQYSASKPLLPTSPSLGRSTGSQRVVVQPFSLLRSPNTRASIADLNQSIRASAAAHIRYEQRATGPNRPQAPPAAACPADDAQQQCRRAFRAIRLC